MVYNGMLAVKEPDSDGDYPYYSTYGAMAHKVFYSKKWPCCSGTLVEGVADYVKNIYFRAKDGVAVNLYAPSRLKWNEHGTWVTLTQESDYPLDGAITIHIACTAPVEFSLQLRVPAWAERSPVVRVNGKPVRTEMRRGFAAVRRRWKTGDTLTLELKQTFRTEAIDDLHPNTIALLRGPLVYVEMNPADGTAKLPHSEALLTTDQMPGTFVAQSALQTRLFAPFYFVQDENYTMYAGLS